jgi:class 3 adenylate cyclase
MKRRSKLGGEPIKGRRRKTPDPKRRSVPKDAPASHVPNSEKELEVRRLVRKLSEAREQQAATSEVLRAISGSSFDLRTVLDILLRSAARLCNADQGTVAQRKGDTFYRSVSYGFSPTYLEYVKDIPVKPGRDTGTGRALLEGKLIHIPDVLANPDFTWKEGQRLGGFRTVLGVPVLRDGVAVGVLALTRSSVQPFSGEQIALVENFAAQAVIAIENARLLNELRQRTTDLTEALEQQAATSEVLQIISKSPGDLEPVFASMLENAARVCEASMGAIYRWDGEGLLLVATHNMAPAYAEALGRSPLRPTPDGYVRRIVETKAVLHFADLAAQPAYAERKPMAVAAVEVGGIRTFVAVPMLKENKLIGTLVLYRREVRPFTDKQIELVKDFANQAVIAIENTRLLKELRERTEEVEKLNQHLEHRVTDQVGEIERMSRLRRFLPPQVADLIVASGSEKQLESHRREITALFCDLRGFTGFTESADAEDVMALLRDYHAAVGELVIRYSGTLERYAGDGVMVVFNDPVPVENPALQAVLMALELRNALGALTQTWSRLGHEIGFGIGIAHGFATLGTIGYEGRFDYAAIGTVSNVASRLCDEAKPGQILISARVLTKVENAVTIEPVGEFELKGIRRPLAAYNVLSAAS